MKDRKAYILEKAFRAFMSKGYDSVSITVLQKELQMSRGAMYRYFTGKDELFAEVVDTYLVGMLNRLVPEVPQETTLPELMDYLHRQRRKLFAFINKENIEINFLNFTALSIQAAKHYPEFIEKLKGIGRRSVGIWENAIRNSIAHGEVREDIDVKIMASLFSSGANYPEVSGGLEQTILKRLDNLKRTEDYLYGLIKAR